MGYLTVVGVHAWLYQRVNRNIARVVPFNLAAALLIIGAGVVQGWAAYVLWAAALAVEQLSPLFTRVRGRFDIQPSHFVERHGALVIVVFGESVVDIGIGAEGHAVDACPWPCRRCWGWRWSPRCGGPTSGSATTSGPSGPCCTPTRPARPALALAAYFFAYIPMLLGVVALASGVKQATVNTGTTLPAGPCVALGCGVALFLAGSAAFRHALGIGPRSYRLAAAAAALAASAVGVTVSVAAETALLTVIVAVSLAAERRAARVAPPGGPGESAPGAGTVEA